MQNNASNLLKQQLMTLQQNMKDAVLSNASKMEQVHEKNRISAENLLHYLYFRSEDQRILQEQLHDAGLSSLGSCESHIHRQVQEVLNRLGETTKTLDPLDRHMGTALIQQNAALLFGEKRSRDIPAIMITYETSLASDPDGIRELISSGMQVARINCAHDNEQIWAEMIRHTREQAALLQTEVKIYMDLAGPKIRTVVRSAKGKSKIRIKEGELFYLVENMPESPQEIGCTLADIVPHLKPEQPIYFDDGKIKAKVLANVNNRALLLIEKVSGKEVLKSEKGINFPGADLPIKGLTAYDLQCLPFIARNSDLIGFSFVNTVSDLKQLRQEFALLELPLLPVILKIETTQAVNNLPVLLLECLKEEVSGVMIARGDLALEVSFERLSEVQEEILWICEAAHVPVIWATQVLESLNKFGLATRSEGTDAAHAAFAECVMLNKGNHLKLVIESLLNILERSASHRLKKRYTFRKLSIAGRFLQEVKGFQE